jgi:indole-3-glycerol phosphate synthase
MATRLDTILASTRATVAAAKEVVAVAQLERRAAAHRPRGWTDALHEKAGGVIADIKDDSPSRGMFHADFDVERMAQP